jgi:uncharacterized membrane protein YfcA
MGNKDSNRAAVMELIVLEILIGLVMGTLIGLTGMGGGVLLLPVLIFCPGLAPIIAVGSDAVFNFVTKIGSSWVHLRKGTVRRRVVIALAAGSLPCSILEVAFLNYFCDVCGSGVNDFIKSAIGVLLVCIPTLLFFKEASRSELLTVRRLSNLSPG